MASFAPPTAGWEAVFDPYTRTDTFYRKVLLYSRLWDDPSFDLNDYFVKGAPYGGALALWKDDTKPQLYRGAQSRQAIEIYSSAGSLIRKIAWDKGSIRGLGWSDDEKLLVITHDGTVRCYYDLQGDFTQYSLGNGAEEFGVKECRFWGSGFVALLGNNRFVAVSRYDEPRPRLLADPQIAEGEIHTWALIPPNYTLSRHIEVLVATGTTILVVDPQECQDHILQRGPFSHITVSPNGKYLALYTIDARVWVISSDFQMPLSEYDTGMGMKLPLDIAWCGNNSVVLVWDNEVHMVAPGGVSLNYYYDSRVHLVPELDGVRMITVDKCEFLQKVPDVTESIFRIGSTSPASVLMDAIDQLEHHSPKADDNIQMIRPNLTEAVDACVKAAGHEFNIHWQKQLLKAASFGKSVLELYNSDEFVEMCETLRVLNAVRHYEVGLALTYEQCIRLTPDKLIQRLLNRQQHFLALRISEYLRLPTDKIYIHWACMKVKLSTDDEDTICRIIVNKLSGKQGISYEEIARTAYDEGRGKLATQLLNYEPRAGRQVPLLLNMEEDEIALDKAVESGDTDLVHYVLLQLKKKYTLSNFFRLINNRPIASALVESSARTSDRELLKDLYYQDDRRADGALVIFEDALLQEDIPPKIEKTKLASKVMKELKDYPLEAKALDESIKLTIVQEAYERDLPHKFLGTSLNQTILDLIRLGYNSRAAKLKSEFNVPEKRFWWLKLRGLVAKRDWGEIEEWSKTKKSPIGWEAFFNECLTARNTKVAALFIPKCTHLSAVDRMDMWVRCGMVLKGAEEAVKVKDVNALEALRTRSKVQQETLEIERMIKQLKPK